MTTSAHENEQLTKSSETVSCDRTGNDSVSYCQITKELASLVRRMAHRLNKCDKVGNLHDVAFAFLHRHNLSDYTASTEGDKQ